MQIRYARIIGTAFVLEALFIAGFIAAATIVFDYDFHYLGIVLIAEITFFFIAGWWVASGLEKYHALNGAILGATNAALEFLFLLLKAREHDPKVLPFFFIFYFIRILLCTSGAIFASGFETQKEPDKQRLEL